jgi:MFS family permease
MAMYGVGMALIGPGLFTGVSLAVGKDEQGKAAGILVSAYAAGFVLNPITGMKLFAFQHNYAYFLGIFLMVLCLTISIIDKRLNRKVEYEEGMGHSGPTG